ncbi:cobalt-precorrin 5A hydrolase [Methanotorris igneus]|uniref:Cobalamin (Vitamin B12) biosynthesis CbiG protein n=1 Tax=Methanotorris igneus (strain DSM 5666 / JCM 11834 / Kol 5) TaxID=880724 RepID=F6BCJ8_METIK|nr:cobalamin biosynthesis protein [Methanotorris igneus]AEF96209.1 cobalamin (vitamin B12) biosynthesis CbiG protein [Methanotorris igneus Kol 5]
MIKVVYITKRGETLASKIKKILDWYYYESEVIHSKNFKITGNERGFIFIMAMGIVLRKFIDEIKNDKMKDAFVIVCSEDGKYIIPILSNHLGGGNYFSNLIAKNLNANVVFTTATDVNGKVGIDELSKIYFLEIPKRKDILKINRKVLDEKVNLILPKNWKPIGNVSNTYNVSYHNRNYVVVDDDIILKPKKIVVGVGARKNIERHKVYWAIKKTLFLRDIPLWRVDAFATIDVKKDEKGILETVGNFKKPLFIFSRNEVNEVYKFRNDLEKSDFVFKTIGVYGVSEPVSILGVKKLANKNFNEIELILRKFKKNGVSIAISVG